MVNNKSLKINVAILGAGFAGLAAAYFLSEEFKVTVLDAKGLGGGASGVSTGLLHPYAGEKGRKSWHAEEAMGEAKLLLKIAEMELGRLVADYGGIVKKGACIGAGDDVEVLGEDHFLIRSGITVFPKLYLSGLWKAAVRRGAELKIQKIEQLSELESFDYIVLAVGSGIFHFPEGEHLKINAVRGQALVCRLNGPMERSLVAKQYTALTEDPLVCHVGATYERGSRSDEPDLAEAIRLLQPSHEVLGVRAGVRVTNPAHYFPILEKINAKTWVLTALGSRGLLYHAYFAKMLASQIVSA
ncbi:MAG: FAD-binding oxidoreductase [Verrucomicrobia bacterium]|nr:FAD-binding oxidoreductase [Verrucomicrobiota bacterium]